MVNQRETALRSNCLLPLLDCHIHELLNAATVRANQMIMMPAQIQLETGWTVLKLVTDKYSCFNELHQDAVDRSNADILVFTQ